MAITCIDFGFLFFQGTTLGIFQAYFLLKQGIQRLKKLQAELSGGYGISIRKCKMDLIIKVSDTFFILYTFSFLIVA